MEQAIFSTSKLARSAAKDWISMMYREELCIRDTVNCPTQGHSWPGYRSLPEGMQEWVAMVEWYEPSAETGHPQFHRDFLTTADIERLNEYLKDRYEMMREAAMDNAGSYENQNHTFSDDRS